MASNDRGKRPARRPRVGHGTTTRTTPDRSLAGPWTRSQANRSMQGCYRHADRRTEWFTGGTTRKILRQLVQAGVTTGTHARSGLRIATHQSRRPRGRRAAFTPTPCLRSSLHVRDASPFGRTERPSKEANLHSHYMSPHTTGHLYAETPASP